MVIIIILASLIMFLGGCALLDWLFGGKGKNIPPSAEFTFSPSTPYVGDTVHFDASASHDPDGEIVTYDWDFGDGNTASGITTTHAYAASGTFTVKLTVTDNKGATDTTSRQITVKEKEQPPSPENKKPVADFTFSPQEPKVGEQVSFDASASYDPDGEIVSYRWEFEPGSTRVGMNVTYIFRAPGSYPVTLTVEDDQGATSSVVKTITVGEVPPQKPVPIFTYTPQKPQLGQQITFDASASYDPDGTIVSYKWDFGDGTTADGVVVTHKFGTPGNYIVTLTVTDDDGASASQTAAIFLTSGKAQILLSFPAPGAEPRGLAWSGSHLWCADVSGEGTLYKINPNNGSVVASIPSPGLYPLGLAWDGRYLWNVDPVEGKILQIDPSSGRVVNDEGIDIPSPDPTGLAWGGGHLWIADGETLRIYELDPDSGEVLNSFPTPGELPKGLAWDGSHLWLVDMVEGIYRIDPRNGNTVDFYELLPGGRAEDLAWDGRHLWLVDSEQGKIYKIGF